MMLLGSESSAEVVSTLCFSPVFLSSLLCDLALVIHNISQSKAQVINNRKCSKIWYQCLSCKAHLPAVRHLAVLPLIKLLCFKDFIGLVFSFLLSTEFFISPPLIECRKLKYKGKPDREGFIKALRSKSKTDGDKVSPNNPKTPNYLQSSNGLRIPNCLQSPKRIKNMVSKVRSVLKVLTVSK
jgi:hypothetical protein